MTYRKAAPGRLRPARQPPNCNHLQPRRSVDKALKIGQILVKNKGSNIVSIRLNPATAPMTSSPNARCAPIAVGAISARTKKKQMTAVTEPATPTRI